MSNVVPKEQQSAYQRWEMTSFADKKKDSANAETSVSALAGQLDQLREQARAEGYATGLAEGRAAGMAEGRVGGITQGRIDGLEQGRAQAAGEQTRLAQLAEVFSAEIGRANELVAAELLDLALDVSKAMLKTALQVRPELVIPVVGDAIRYLPTVQQPALLFVNPDDAALITQHMGDELTKAGWRVAEEMSMARGGCRVETASNQIDSGIETRWQRIAAALGKDLDWLA